MSRKKRFSMVLAILITVLGIIFSYRGASLEKAEDYSQKVEAALLMQQWMDAIVQYKAEVGLELTTEDIHGTGLIGVPYTGITTTLGPIEAKRTAANPDMAALMVQMLREAGVKPGDTVAAGFSGSFPGMNLATLAACQAMGIQCVYVASVGSSTYGANQPEFTFPDMLCRLYMDDLLTQPPQLFTLGGDYDCGLNMDEELKAIIVERIEGYGIAPLMTEPDFEKNLDVRRSIYDSFGDIACYVGVGGNVTNLGPGEKEVPYGLLKPGAIRQVDKNSGLVQRYSKDGLPVLHILNMKKLMTDYGLPYDPEYLLPIGESDIFYREHYPAMPVILCSMCALLCLLMDFGKLRLGNKHDCMIIIQRYNERGDGL